jgi:hypothetical protein
MFFGLFLFKNLGVIGKPWYRVLLGVCMMSMYAGAQNNVSDSSNFSFDGYSLQPGENASEKMASNLFVKAIPSTTRVFEGEALEVEYFLFSRVGFDGSVGKRPGFDGFSVIEMPLSIAPGTNRYQQAFGKTFKVYSLRRVQLTPLVSGKLPLPKMEVEGYVNFVLAQKNNTDPGLQPTTTSRVAISNTATFIEVLPLPAQANETANIPPVGQFEIVASAPAEIAMGRTHLLTISISGQGQWSQVVCPALPWPPSLIPFEPKVTDQLDSQRVPVRGVRVFQIPFEAKAPGKSVVPGISFTYFDAKAGVYKTVQTKPIPITTVVAAAAVVAPRQQGTTATAVFSRWAPLALAAVAFILLLWVIWPRQKMQSSTSSPSGVPFSAPDMAISKQSLPAGKRHNTIHEANNNMDHRMMESPAQMAAFQYKQLLTAYLQTKPNSIEISLQESITAFLNQCDAVLYGPPQTAEETQQLQTQYKELLHALNDQTQAH